MLRQSYKPNNLQGYFVAGIYSHMWALSTINTQLRKKGVSGHLATDEYCLDLQQLNHQPIRRLNVGVLINYRRLQNRNTLALHFLAEIRQVIRCFQFWKTAMNRG